MMLCGVRSSVQGRVSFALYIFHIATIPLLVFRFHHISPFRCCLNLAGSACAGSGSFLLVPTSSLGRTAVLVLFGTERGHPEERIDAADKVSR